ncbi:GNAT family N-acetyltransferase [Pseudoruegeria sp. HB172150]|uniref:GNAT family N-acetyltransferase n=1 Tax=Pseudoruegeria sp. HB172150 TaxID=2721164 RepID=UPI0015549C94|nr:GNAT family N-acyltransferase [Pseudoruegeria sp. HB172150]
MKADTPSQTAEKPVLAPEFEVRLAAGPDDLRAAQRLRYEVFVKELGGSGPLVDHAAGLERDELDPHFDHLMLFDRARKGEQVVGVYRLLRYDQAAQLGRYYSETEYDLTPLLFSGRRLLELGRSCLHRDYRGGTAMYELWSGLADYVLKHGIEVLFGVASFHGTDTRSLAAPLSLLHHRHLASPELRVRARADHYQDMNLLPEHEIDRVAAMRAVPALIKAYLRLGGFVGEGAWIDHAFNTTDICLVMDTTRMSDKHRSLYTGGRAR